MFVKLAPTSVSIQMIRTLPVSQVIITVRTMFMDGVKKQPLLFWNSEAFRSSGSRLSFRHDIDLTYFEASTNISSLSLSFI